MPARTERADSRTGRACFSGCILQPALQAAKIPGNVGWHTLRHTFGTLMKANGEDIKTIQELLRHANYKVTADTKPGW
ncbi:MAG: tyrosine-type recombinase/integrase [Candidatus Sulfotelmatobacter sp.]